MMWQLYMLIKFHLCAILIKQKNYSFFQLNKNRGDFICITLCTGACDVKNCLCHRTRRAASQYAPRLTHEQNCTEKKFTYTFWLYCNNDDMILPANSILCRISFAGRGRTVRDHRTDQCAPCTCFVICDLC